MAPGVLKGFSSELEKIGAISPQLTARLAPLSASAKSSAASWKFNANRGPGSDFARREIRSRSVREIAGGRSHTISKSQGLASGLGRAMGNQ